MHCPALRHAAYHKNLTKLFITPTLCPPRERRFGSSFPFTYPAKVPMSPYRNVNGKRPQRGHSSQATKFMKKRRKAIQDISAETVLLADVQTLLASQRDLEDDAHKPPSDREPDTLPAPGSEVELEVVQLSSTGDGLARIPGATRIYAVPFSIPGDIVKVKIFRHLENEDYSIADFLSIVKPSPLRDDSRIRCPYFAKCSGCQFQMLDYPEQLRLKKTIVEKAYKNFSQLPPELIPAIQDTMGSPLQYGYRTKLTPHFDAPPGATRRGPKVAWQEMPPVGFSIKGSKRVIDIEDCPIGTDAVRKGMKMERERMAVEFGKYQRGATILLRENTKRAYKSTNGDEKEVTEGIPSGAVKVETDRYTDHKTCLTDHNATSTEYIDDFTFTSPAGSFFQNNNSILSPFTDYVRQHALPPPPPDQPSPSAPSPKQIKYLIDAYSGSGLFTITLSSLFPGGSTGIDIDDKAIGFARRNAALNGLADPARCRFIAADAPQLFQSVVGVYDPDETVVVIDPPRKGCDASFLRQLLAFAPRRVLYVSCNVHTQARDVGMLVRGVVDGFGIEDVRGSTGTVKQEGEEKERVEDGAEMKKTVRYEIESLKGFDFFPQTGHVEGVAVLNRVDQ